MKVNSYTISKNFKHNLRKAKQLSFETQPIGKVYIKVHKVVVQMFAFVGRKRSCGLGMGGAERYPGPPRETHFQSSNPGPIGDGQDWV